MDGIRTACICTREHVMPISGDLPDGAGPHYNVTWDPVSKLSVSLSATKTEVWLDLDVDSDGDARSTATVSFIPEGERSIVLHAEADRS